MAKDTQDAEQPTPVKRPAHDPRGLEQHRAMGHDLIPLHKWDHRDAEGRERGKSPRDLGWRAADYGSFDPAAHMSTGGNVGVRLGPADLVLDCDPRHYADGDNPLDRLCSDFRIDRAACPTVITGSGGLHLYLRREPGPPPLTSLADYPGIEFKTSGTQVVAAGSVHPSGGAYEWDPLSQNAAPAAPRALLRMLARPERPAAAEGGVYSPEQVATMLAALDPLKFGGNERWTKLCMAVHHASGGEARQEFLDWCARDGRYASAARENARRWDSLSASGAGATITRRTLDMILREAGPVAAATIPREAAAAEFADAGPAELPPGAVAIAPDRMARAAPPSPFRPTDFSGMAEAWLEGRDVVRWSDWLEYDGSAYRPVDDEKMRADAWRWMRRQTVEGRKGAPEPLDPTRERVANLLEAAASQRLAPRPPPCWLAARDGDPDPAHLVSMANGILDPRSRTLLPATPRLLTLNALPFAYDARAKCPRWELFLEELWPDEADQREALREAFGYMVSGQTWLQKAFFIQGGTRSGKGTIGRVLVSLLGEWSYCAPTARTMAGDFGLESFVGKLLALVSDMRMGKGADHTTMVENVLRVSGEDGVTVQRKNKTDWIGTLKTRFLILSNDPLQVRDESGAFLGRMVVLTTRASFYGREDTTLTEKLTAELPGILNWSLDGLDWVRAVRTIEQPASSAQLIDLMRSASNPVGEFVAERCKLGPRMTCGKDEIWREFELWASGRGMQFTGQRVHFFIELYKAASRVDQWGRGYSKLRGIALKPGSGRSG